MATLYGNYLNNKCNFKQTIATNDYRMRQMCVTRVAQMANKDNTGLTIDDIAAQFATKICKIQVVRGKKCNTKFMGATGTGVVVEGSKYVVTSFHVVEETRIITLQMFDWDPSGDIRLLRKPLLTGRVVYHEPWLDLALLRVSDPNSMSQLTTPAVIADRQVSVGERIMGSGRLDNTYTVSDGIVVSLDRTNHSRPYHGTFIDQDFGHVQHTSPLYPGFSGGPVVDMNGHVIGINSSGSVRYGQTYAVDSVTVNEFITRGLKFDTEDVVKRYTFDGKTSLGIAVKTLTPEIIQSVFNDYKMDINSGVVVTAKMSTNDHKINNGLNVLDIIIGVNDSTISSVNELIDCINKCKPDVMLNITICRLLDVHKHPFTQLDARPGSFRCSVI